MTAATTAPAPTRSHFATADPLRARTFMDQTYGGRLVIKGSRESSWQLSVDQVAARQVVSGDVRLPADLTFEVDGHDEVVVNTVLAGSVEYENDDLDERCRLGDVYAGNHPDLHCVCHTHELRSHTITLPRSLIAGVAADADGESAVD
ncbi:MAG: hypothetical protein JOZ07_13670 [Solirubrobacterales bacterium]|nr:hypothetical protein [Solirubrobacterales bacterium]